MFNSEQNPTENVHKTELKEKTAPGIGGHSSCGKCMHTENLLNK